MDLLTPREREVLHLMAAGLTNAEIAERLGISFATAKTHVSDILNRLGVDSREGAVAMHRGGAARPSRRRWLTLPLAKVMGGVTATAAVVGGIAVVGGLWPDSDVPRDEIRIPLADLSVEMPLELSLPEAGQSHLGTPYPVWLVRHEDGSVDAFVGRDPHGGCHVPYEPAYVQDRETEVISSDRSELLAVIPPFTGAFKARCTGWVFLRTGEVFFGAASRGLDRFPTRIEGDEVVVELDLFLLGRCTHEAVHPCSSPGRDVLALALPAPAWLAGQPD
jgi:DNA-binding CsgD family transcriptional regulator/nitrite reductase/ring-hydroxylating ferredoxin subunit